MLDGVYVRAFEEFLINVDASWPEKTSDPLVGLFLLICDMSINPGVGFPFPVEPFHEHFIDSVNPGARFAYFSRLVGMRFPAMKSAVQEQSRDEYVSVSSELAQAFTDYPPLLTAELFAKWFAPKGKLSHLRHQYESYDFAPMNFVIGHLFAHFLAFQEDKFTHPEYFCWPGVWMAGESLDQLHVELFEKHGALFVDKEDDDGIFPRLVAGRDEAKLHEVYERFYTNSVVFDLANQWIRAPGPFRYNIEWLSSKASRADGENHMRRTFQSAFGIDPEDVEILSE